jgi:hypothetical protein
VFIKPEADGRLRVSGGFDIDALVEPERVRGSPLGDARLGRVSLPPSYSGSVAGIGQKVSTPPVDAKVHRALTLLGRSSSVSATAMSTPRSGPNAGMHGRRQLGGDLRGARASAWGELRARSAAVS